MLKKQSDYRHGTLVNLNKIVVVFLSLPTNSGITRRLSHEYFLSNRYQFSIHQSSNHWKIIFRKGPILLYTYVGVLVSLWLFLFAAQQKEFFMDGLMKFEERSQVCGAQGEYVK
jgi:hypothetical protein